MKEIVIISGKGGTGKTSMVSSFAAIAGDHVLCDADVDAADLHLIMAPEFRRTEIFQSGHKARINLDLCTRCDRCRELCRWDAISSEYRVNTIDCEGCGVCVHFCPEKAVEFPLATCGQWFVSNTRFGSMVHARLGIAEENSGKLVSLVRREAQALAAEEAVDLILTDGPPGVGCPVIAAIGGASAVLIVAEPTVSGKHDVQRVIELAAHFKVPAFLCVNKYDLNPETAADIRAASEQQGVRFIGEMPFDPVFTDAMVQGKTVFEYAPDADACRHVRTLWQRLQTALTS